MDRINLAQDKNGYEPSSSMNFWEFAEQLSNCKIPKKGSAPYSLLVHLRTVPVIQAGVGLLNTELESVGGSGRGLIYGIIG